MRVEWLPGGASVANQDSSDDVERSCQAVSPNDERCDYPATVNSSRTSHTPVRRRGRDNIQSNVLNGFKRYIEASVSRVRQSASTPISKKRDFRAFPPARYSDASVAMRRLRPPLLCPHLAETLSGPEGYLTSQGIAPSRKKCMVTSVLAW